MGYSSGKTLESWQWNRNELVHLVSLPWLIGFTGHEHENLVRFGPSEYERSCETFNFIGKRLPTAPLRGSGAMAVKWNEYCRCCQLAFRPLAHNLPVLISIVAGHAPWQTFTPPNRHIVSLLTSCLPRRRCFLPALDQIIFPQCSMRYRL